MNEYADQEGTCAFTARDGNPCARGDHRHHLPDYHESKEQFEEGERLMFDRTRPYWLEAGKPGAIPDGWGNMVPITIHFTDGNPVGKRVVGWMRPEDVWMLIPEDDQSG